MRFSWALTHRVTTVAVAGALAALAFSRDTRGWDIVGAVLAGIAIADVLILIAVARFRWNRRPGGRHHDERRVPRPDA